MIYRPSTSSIEKLRALFQRRVRDGQLAYLGNASGVTAVPGLPGFRYVRFPYGKDENGYVLFSEPTIARSGSAAYMDYAGAAVYVAYNRDNELEIVSGSYPEMD